MMIERVLKQATHQPRIGLLPSNYCEPLSYLESEQYLNGNANNEITAKIQQAYCAHYHWGTGGKAKIMAEQEYPDVRKYHNSF